MMFISVRLSDFLVCLNRKSRLFCIKTHPPYSGKTLTLKIDSLGAEIFTANHKSLAAKIMWYYLAKFPPLSLLAEIDSWCILS